MRPVVVHWLARLIGHPAAAALAPGYFTMASIAGLVCAAIVLRRARREGDDVAAVLRALRWGYVGAIGGGIVIPMLVDLGTQLAAGRWPALRWAGMVAYAGFACGLGLAALSLRRSGAVSLARFGELIAAPIGLAIALVRVGCFLGGCDYGQVTAVPWAVRFPQGSPAFVDQVQAGLLPATRLASLPVHPTQLYEALLGLLIFLVVSRLPRRRFLATAVAYAIGRFAIETLRGDASRGLFGPASTSQVLSLVVLALAAIAVLKRPILVAAAAALFALAPRPAEAAPWDLSLLVGSDNAINRPDKQVPQLGGLSLLGTWNISSRLGVGGDIDYMVNEVARHSSFLASLSFSAPLSPRFDVGFRAGLGFTSIAWNDESFKPIVGLDVRAAATIDWNLSPRWRATLWPVAIDSVSAKDLGGPIVCYEFRIGIAYRFGVPAEQPVAPPPPVPPTYYPPPPQPQPPPPPPPESEPAPMK